MKNLKLVFNSFLLLAILLSCTKNSDIQPQVTMTPIEMLQSKTWDVYDHTKNGESFWQSDSNFGSLTFRYTIFEEQNGEVVWSFKDNAGQVYSKCSGSYQMINDTNVLNTFSSPECEMGEEAFVLIITPGTEELIMNGTIEGDSWIFRLR